ncbi:hypothetical protein [Escherichia coli]|uniref:hypothetical protein n=2 Tax=Escherichia coli TaxID=562 RepID=UPI001C49727F|nr:hypothetical protein [Escherichia coli]MBV7681552.1 hypothetical protein [Escherichia coli]UNS24206.1 hypothetical protein [Escherichia coli]
MNQKWKTLIDSVLTPSSIISGIALIVLWGYFSRLHRLDIIFDVMNIKSILVLVCCTTILSLIMIIFIFFITSFFIPIVIPYDIKILPAYNKIQANFLSVMMLSGLFPMAYIYVLYCAFEFDQSVKDNSGWLSISSIGVLIVVISAIINTRYLEYDLSFKNIRMILLRRDQIYLIIPLSIALLVHLQVIPLEMVLRNIETSDKSINFKVIAELAFMSYFIFILTILPGLIYLKMNPQHKLSQRISSAFVASMMILLVISTQITVLPVIFTHSVIKLSRISDFSIHSYIIKTCEYPEEFFTNAVWGKKNIKPGEYYSVQAVSMFTTNQFILLSPKDIIRFYRESWKFDLHNVDFDTNTRKKLQEEAAYCVPISAISVKRWDMPLQGSKPSN